MFDKILNKLKYFSLIVIATLGVLIQSNIALAACANPAGSAGDQMYNSTHNVMQFCDGTHWTAMKKATETDPQVNTLTANRVCKANSAGTLINCSISMPTCTGANKGLSWTGSAFTCRTYTTQKGCANSGTSWGAGGCSSSATGIQLHGTVLLKTDSYCCAASTCNGCSGKTGSKNFTCTNGSWTQSGGAGCSNCSLGATNPTHCSCTNNCSCFIAGTIISMADGSEKTIEKLAIGDVVLGMDGMHNKVLGMEAPPIGGRVLYAFNGGNFFVTREHPFMLETGQWASVNPDATKDEKPEFTKKYGAIKPLEVGDTVVLKDGKKLVLETIESRDRYTKTMPVYNPLLDGNHTYYADGFLVHNKM